MFGKAKAVNNTFRIIYQQSNIAMDVNIGMYCTMLCYGLGKESGGITI